MNLYLIGYRGSGKSTVGPLLARHLGWKSVDADDLVEFDAKKSIAEIFAADGEAEFRQLETQVIQRVSKASNWIVSLGGGAPMFPTNREFISCSGKVVYLSASLDVLWGRIAADETTGDRRPDLTELGGQAEVEQLLKTRIPIYEACADYTVNVDDASPEEIAEAIVQWLQTDDRTSGDDITVLD
ncbi:MAG: shikimate kinase [Mariniblastus sp.]|nr:shikimate kinase [Mariniblastus sp.]